MKISKPQVLSLNAFTFFGISCLWQARQSRNHVSKKITMLYGYCHIFIKNAEMDLNKTTIFQYSFKKYF